MDEELTRKLQAKTLEILLYFDSFCRENGLTAITSRPFHGLCVSRDRR